MKIRYNNIFRSIDNMFKLLDAVGCSIELNLIDNHANSTD